ncbi:11650_t:CDS:10 [Diversispora eburnea]|uniref:Mannosyl-oligosaccharide glucosidase n=1 Tax=Diversispora eburnea TaxID=1213867 RepID=A0A9N9F4T9_9GLOM|nr:11650_t:CDS:10 [Diversispora eburnea]
MLNFTTTKINQFKQFKKFFIYVFTLIIIILIIQPISTFELDFDSDNIIFNNAEIDNIQFLENKIIVNKASNNSLLWGTYRPNLYFGTRPRLPESLMTGLIWFGLNDDNSIHIRHSCEQSDELKEYSYKKHDGRSFSLQTITDVKNNLILKTEYLKVPGGDWAVRITGNPIYEEMPSRISFLYYFGLEGEGSLELKKEERDEYINTTDLTKMQYWGHLVPDGDVWRAREYFTGLLAKKVDTIRSRSSPDFESPFPPPSLLYTLNNEVRENANFYMFQKMVEVPFQFDIFFESDSSPNHIEDLTKSLEISSQEYDVKFEKVFGLAAKGFNDKHIYFAQTMLSNLLGGIGIVDRSYTEDDYEEFGEDFSQRKSNPKLSSPAALFTATPSRPFFPRGFYWDEGFHQLLIGEWDNDLSLEIIKSWISLIDDDGWVGREQILGEEARNKVYHLSSTMDPEIISNRYLYDQNLAKSYLIEIYPKLRANYNWFRRTQWGEIKEWGRSASNSKEAYRWRGRTPGHTLTSGLDDYPRAQPPHPAELHVDLMCWVGFMARSLTNIANRLGIEDDIEDFGEHYENILNNLDDLHWSDKYKAYCDVSVDENGKYNYYLLYLFIESIHVCHKGYLSLFPMLLGLLPNDSPKLGSILDLIYDPNELWSPTLKEQDMYGNNTLLLTEKGKEGWTSLVTLIMAEKY